MVSINTDILPPLPAADAASVPGASKPPARPGFGDHLARARRPTPDAASGSQAPAAPVEQASAVATRQPAAESRTDAPPVEEKPSPDAAAEVESPAGEQPGAAVPPQAVIVAPPIAAGNVALTEASLPWPVETAEPQTAPGGHAEEAGDQPPAPPVLEDAIANSAVELVEARQLAVEGVPPARVEGSASENRAHAEHPEKPAEPALVRPVPTVVVAASPAAPRATSSAVAPPLRVDPRPEGHAADEQKTAEEQPTPLPAHTVAQPPSTATAAGALTAAEPVAGDGHGSREAAERVEPVSHEARPATSSAVTADPAAAPTPRLPVSLAAHGGAGGERPSGLSEVQRVRFVQRVARAFQAIGEHGSPLRLRLSPPELGSLRLEISVSQGQLSARVEAETPSARALLLDSLPALRERLEQQDIKIARFDVDLFEQARDGLPQNQQRRPTAEDMPTPSGLPRKTAAADGAAAPIAAAGMTRDGHLNVVI